jgi:hypothetical protein
MVRAFSVVVLVAQTTPVDVVVIDHVGSTPTAN